MKTKQAKPTAKGRIDFTAKRVNPAQIILRVGGQNLSPTGGGNRTPGVWVSTELLHSPGPNWDDWFETAFELVPEAGSAIEQLSSLVSGFNFVAKQGDQESVDLLNSLINQSQIALRETIRTAVWNYYTYGRTYVQPVWQGSIRNSELASLRSPPPSSMTVIHANQKELAKLTEAYQKAKLTQPAAPTKLNGDTVGFVQAMGDLPPNPFLATEIIFIPRNTPKYPDGLSVLRNLYRKVISVSGTEEMLTRLTRTYSNPPWYFKIGSSEYPCEPNAQGQKMVDFVKTQLGPLVEAGNYENITQLMLPNWVEFILPRFDVPIAGPLMDHIKGERDAILVSIGVPPGIISAEGFRATAHEALTFLDDRIQPIRDLFERRLTDDLLKPWLTFKHGGALEGTSWFMPDWAWKDITPGDMDQLRLSLVQSSGGPFMTRDEARVIHGGLPSVEVQQKPAPSNKKTPQPPLHPTPTPTTPVQPPTQPTSTPGVQGMTVQLLEKQHGKPLKEIISETMFPENHPMRSHRAAARILGVSPTTLYKWRQSCGLFPV